MPHPFSSRRAHRGRFGAIRLLVAATVAGIGASVLFHSTGAPPRVLLPALAPAPPPPVVVAAGPEAVDAGEPAPVAAPGRDRGAKPPRPAPPKKPAAAAAPAASSRSSLGGGFARTRGPVPVDAGAAQPPPQPEPPPIEEPPAVQEQPPPGDPAPPIELPADSAPPADPAPAEQPATTGP